jgi:MFS family permease
LGLAAAGIVLLVLFILQEQHANEPIIPLRLWQDKVFSVASGLEFLVGFAMFGGIIYLPLWLQTVGGASAQNSGLLILPLMAGLMISSITSGRLITKTGRYKRYPVIGTATIAVGLFLLSTMGVGTSRWLSSGYMVILGLGIGMIIQIMVLAVQNSVPHSDLGTATATETFTRSMGGAFGVAVFGAILTNRLVYNLDRLLPGAAQRMDLAAITGSPAAIRALPAATQTAVIQALANSIHIVFLAAVPLALLAFVVTWFLPEKPLRQTAHIGVEGVGEELLVGLAQTEPDTPIELATETPGSGA